MGIQNLPFLAQGQYRFRSMNHVLNGSDIAGQHMVEWFSGSSLNTDRWTITSINSTGSMSDSVNGGYLLTTGTNNNDIIELDFNQKRQYSNTASEVISVWKAGTSGNVFENAEIGLMGDNYAISGIDRAGWVLNNAIASASYFLESGNSSGVGYVWTSVPYDTNYHVFKSSLSASGMTGSIDGVAVGTTTTNLPSGKMQPHIHRQYKSDDGVARILNIAYMECYNT